MGLQWGETQKLTTPRGPTLMRSAPPTEEFWELWRTHKEVLRNHGITTNKFRGEWSVNWWQRDGEFKIPVLRTVEPEDSEPPCDLEIEPLVNESNLKPWQPKLVQWLVAAMKAWGNELNACGTGVGKTFITLGVARERNQKLLVVCPKNITIDWVRAAFIMGVEIEAHGWEWMKTGKTRFGHWEMIPSKKKGGRAKKGNFIWTVPEGWDVAFDEAHRASGIGTQNALLVKSAADAGLPIHLLSATLADDPTKMEAAGRVLGLHKGGQDFYSWMSQHGVVEQNLPVAGGRKIKLYKFKGDANDLKRIHRKIFPNHGIRVTAESLGDVFPPNTTIAKPYVMDEEEAIRDAYMEMQARVAEIEMKRDMKASEKQACILVEQLRARQRVELLKVPLLVSLTRDYREEGNSVFIAVNFKETIIQLRNELKGAGVIAGLSTGKDITGEKYNEHVRRNFIDDFQSNKIREIIGIIPACREGLNLQDMDGKAPRVSLILPPVSSFALRQVLGRIWRSTGVSPSLQNIVFAANTIEEQVCERLATKIDQLDLLMDGDLTEGLFPEGYSDMRESEEEED